MADAKSLVPVRELPVSSWTEFDSLTLVKLAIRQMDLGLFDLAAQVIDGMMMDDRIPGLLAARFSGMLGLPLELDEKGDGRQKKMVAKRCKEDFWKMFARPDLAEFQQWGHMLGISIAQTVWEKTPGYWLPHLNVVHPRFLRFDVPSGRLILTTLDGQETIEPGGDWVVFTPYGAKRGWMRGLVRALFVPWLIKQWALRDAARHSEMWGSPLRKAITPAGAPDDMKKAFFEQVALLGADSTIRIPAFLGGNGEKFDVELLEAVSQGAPFLDLEKEMNLDMAVAVLGQNLTTEVKGGSYAAAYVHQNVRADILSGDAELISDCLEAQPLKRWAYFNFGSEELAPKPNWDTNPPEDLKSKGDGLKAIGEGIKSLQAVGAKPDVDQLLKDAAVPVTEKAGPPPAPVAAPGAPGEGENGAAPNAPAPTQPRAQARVDLARGGAAGQLYVDTLVDVALGYARAFDAPELEKLEQAIREAQSFEELRSTLAPTLARMDETERTELVYRLLVLSELAGRWAVLSEG